MPTDIIIRKIVLRVRTSNEAQALELRQNLGAGLQMGVIYLLDQVSRQIDLPLDEQVFQNRMELNLGAQKDLSADALLLLLQREMPEQFIKLVSKAAATDAAAEGDPEARRDELAALFYFFAKGYLPWWHTSGASPVQLVQSLWDTRKEALWALLQAFCQRNAHHDVRRMVAVIPASLQLSFAEWLVKANQDANGMLQAMLSNTRLLAAAFSAPAAFITSELLQLLLQPFADDQPVGKRLISRLLQKQAPVAPETVLLERDFEQGTQIIAWIQELRVFPLIANEAANKAGSPADADLEEGGTGVYVEDAGLILLHPFLPSLFATLGWLDANNHFLNAACRQKAVALLHYLVYGDTPVEEWTLVFAKILCGLKPGDFFDPYTVVKEADKIECKVLLAAVISYWDALRSASAEAMMATFILRNGKLSWQGSHWLLQIERNAADILIDRLPWGIGVVRLPWLQHMIYTEW